MLLLTVVLTRTFANKHEIELPFRLQGQLKLQFYLSCIPIKNFPLSISCIKLLITNLIAALKNSNPSHLKLVKFNRV